jgi:hypothetical protein
LAISIFQTIALWGWREDLKAGCKPYKEQVTRMKRKEAGGATVILVDVVEGEKLKNF